MKYDNLLKSYYYKTYFCSSFY